MTSSDNYVNVGNGEVDLELQVEMKNDSLEAQKQAWAAYSERLQRMTEIQHYSFQNSIKDVMAKYPLFNKSPCSTPGTTTPLLCSLNNPNTNFGSINTESEIPDREREKTMYATTQQHSFRDSIRDYIAKSPLIRNYPIIRTPLFRKAGQAVLLLKENHVSLEFLNPRHDCKSRKSSYSTAVLGLVATVCGGGLLSLPLCFDKAGIIPTTILIICGAFKTYWTSSLLVDSEKDGWPILW